jgi:hypothetical protein
MAKGQGRAEPDGTRRAAKGLIGLEATGKRRIAGRGARIGCGLRGEAASDRMSLPPPGLGASSLSHVC